MTGTHQYLTDERNENVLIYVDGEIVLRPEAKVSVFDSGFLLGDGVWEGIRLHNGHLAFLDAHLDRLYGSLDLLEIDCGLTLDEMEARTLQTLERNQPTEAEDVDWQIMHNVSRGPLPLYGTVFGGQPEPTVTINCWPLITHMAGFVANYQNGLRLAICAQQAIPAHLLDPKAKTRSRMHYQMAVLQGARLGEGIWPVMLDPDGFLAEGPGWNVFLVKDGVISTPEPRNCLLGVSRGNVLELAGQLGIPVREANLGRYEALRADEIFCTSTTYCICHAVSFEGQAVGTGTAGPVFQQLQAAWKEQVGVDFVAQAEAYAARLTDWRETELAVEVS